MDLVISWPPNILVFFLFIGESRTKTKDNEDKDNQTHTYKYTHYYVKIYSHRCRFVSNSSIISWLQPKEINERLRWRRRWFDRRRWRRAAAADPHPASVWRAAGSLRPCRGSAPSGWAAASRRRLWAPGRSANTRDNRRFSRASATAPRQSDEHPGTCRNRRKNKNNALGKR